MSSLFPLLPLVGYAIFFAELIFVTPNAKWVFALFLWSLCAVLFASWLAKGSLTQVVEFLDRHAARIAIGMILVMLVASITVNILQAEYFTMGARARDMAYYSQILWNTLQGHLLAGNLNQDLLFRPPVSSDFALHVSPFLLVGVLPIYFVFPSFLTLLILRDVAMAAAAWPLFLIARQYLGGVGGVAAVMLYFVNPAVMSQTFQEFTPLHLAPLPFFFALWAFTREELGKFIAWMLIAMSMREDVAVTMAGFGLWAFITGRGRRWVVAGLGIPLAWWGVSTLLIQPAFGRWGNNISEISLAGGERAPLGIYQILDPVRAIDVLRNGGLHFLYRLLRSLAFLPVLGAEGVLAAPVLAANLFYGSMSHEGIEPTSRLALLPSCALVGAAVLITARLCRKYQADRRLFALLLLLLFPSANLLDGTKDTLQEGMISYTLHNDADALWEVVDLIPDNASVAAPGYILPVLSKRSKLFNLPQLHMYPEAQPDYILIDHDLDRVTSSPQLNPIYKTLLEKLSRCIEYETVWKEGEYALLQRTGAKDIRDLSSEADHCGIGEAVL